MTRVPYNSLQSQTYPFLEKMEKCALAFALKRAIAQHVSRTAINTISTVNYANRATQRTERDWTVIAIHHYTPDSPSSANTRKRKHSQQLIATTVKLRAPILDSNGDSETCYYTHT